MNRLIAVLVCILVAALVSGSAWALSCSVDSDCPEPEGVGYARCSGDSIARTVVEWQCTGSECVSSVSESLTPCSEECVDDRRYVEEPTCKEHMLCPGVVNPVCGIDLQTYPNECYLFATGVEKLHGGECRDNNSLPQLINGSVDPLQGDRGTEFSFTVIYKDENGDRGTVWIDIDGDVFEMHEERDENSSYRNGTPFAYSIELLEGSHTYMFTGSDGYDTVQTEEYQGPEVRAAPTIENPEVRIGDSAVWSFGGQFTNAVVSGLADYINNYLKACLFVSGVCRIPVILEADSEGRIELSGLDLFLYPHIRGDVFTDYKVDMTDLDELRSSFGSIFGGERYNPNADVNGDRLVDILDLAIIGLNYGVVV